MNEFDNQVKIRGEMQSLLYEINKSAETLRVKKSYNIDVNSDVKINSVFILWFFASVIILFKNSPMFSEVLSISLAGLTIGLFLFISDKFFLAEHVRRWINKI